MDEMVGVTRTITIMNRVNWNVAEEPIIKSSGAEDVARQLIDLIVHRCLPLVDSS